MNTTPPPKVAIIGTGIAGLTCAWHLRKQCELQLFEKEAYAGGHTNTIEVKETNTSVPIDTGFMVYNHHTYPHLLKLFRELDIPEIETNMSFSVSDKTTGLSYNSNGFQGFFAQKSNIINPFHWSLLLGVRKFYAIAQEFIKEDADESISIGEFFSKNGLSKRIADQFLYPMASAIWSTHHDGIMDYPAASLLRFMENHGLLGFGNQFKWKTIPGGSRVYRDKILASLEEKPSLNRGINSVSASGSNQGATITDTQNESHHFDHVIIATHADQALRLLEHPNSEQETLLSPFKYNKNRAVLHSDASVMPSKRKAWASWNYTIQKSEIDGSPKASTHYWMNQLQDLKSANDYFVSIDYPNTIEPCKVHWSATYEHPCFNKETLQAQKELHRLNNHPSISFCGSYFRNGFHEDAHVSALSVVDKLKTSKPSARHELMPV